MCFTKAYKFIVKKLENKIVYLKENVECRHLIFGQGVRVGSTVLLQNLSQIGGLKSIGSPCEILRECYYPFIIRGDYLTASVVHNMQR
jgi:hypothetical protein